jgi:hypothetical protein
MLRAVHKGSTQLSTVLLDKGLSSDHVLPPVFFSVAYTLLGPVWDTGM